MAYGIGDRVKRTAEKQTMADVPAGTEGVVVTCCGPANTCVDFGGNRRHYVERNLDCIEPAPAAEPPLNSVCGCGKTLGTNSADCMKCWGHLRIQQIAFDRAQQERMMEAYANQQAAQQQQSRHQAQPAGELHAKCVHKSYAEKYADALKTANAQSNLLTGLRSDLADVKGDRDRLRAEKADLEARVAFLERENVRLAGLAKRSR